MLVIHSDEGDKSEIVIGNAYIQVYYAPDFFIRVIVVLFACPSYVRKSNVMRGITTS